jgi:uncharacterized protein (TIGR02231 family)
MKKIVLGFLAAALLAASAPVGAMAVPSEIKKVTLFSDRALVQRTATVVVESGMKTIELEITPFRIDPDSVTARVFGLGEVLGVQYKQLPIEASPRDNVRALEEKLRVQTHARRKLMDRRNTLDRQGEFLSAFVEFSKVQVPREIQTRLPGADDLNQTLNFLDTGFGKIDRETQEIDRQKERLDREIDVLKRELAALRRPAKKNRQVIEVVFNSNRDQRLRIEAEYLVRRAAWHPMYKVSVPASLASVDLTLLSKIRQKTGENWSNVSLALSNAIPLSGTRLPKAPTWILDLPRPMAKARRAPVLAMQRTARDGVDMEENAVMAEPTPEAGFAAARRHRSPLAFEYALPGLRSIESRDKDTILPLFSKTLQGRFHHYAVPQQNRLTFLVCQAEADKELLAGPLNLYLAGQYVGKIMMEEKKAGDAFRLGLGADREVRVRREKIQDKVRETLFGTFERNQTIRELAYRISAENLKDRPVTIDILDSVPVSRTDKIQVRDIVITPPPDEKAYQGREGVLRWKKTVAPGESQIIDITFVVVYPKDQPPPNL